MQRYRILHRTYYNFCGPVRLDPHFLRLRPRESHELRVESSSLIIEPAADISWHRDVEDNSVATATFRAPTQQLLIESQVVIQQFNESPFNFLVAEYAASYPFLYNEEDFAVLLPYIGDPRPERQDMLDRWISETWTSGQPVQTFDLLSRLSLHIHRSFTYQAREEPGVQSAETTLTRRSGSCRDFALLFMAASRRLGLAARFLSGYLHAQPSYSDFGATHAWAEVYLPGAGWKGFDPTLGLMAGSDHITVAIARSPESVPPVAGSFTGPPGSRLDVGVWVTAI